MAAANKSNARHHIDPGVIGIDRDDLFLLMESYKNTIELNTTLLERQEVLNQNIDRAMTEIAGLCAAQTAIMEEVKKIPAAITAHQTALVATIEGHRKNEIKEHSTHTNRIYVAMIGMGVIIISLVGLVAKLINGGP
jgi:hypothetical protein